ncbi:MAG: PEP-CTERM sorting domain-containing protein [Desulfovibrionales bacterium]|nr:MAG: PEP-CTERM sorting domain-containing protein [Desulfovibrionales bacterium]
MEKDSFGDINTLQHEERVMKLRKLSSMVAALFLSLFLAVNAQAFSSFSWDLSTIGIQAAIAGTGTTSVINFDQLYGFTNAGNFAPDATVEQDLGADGILNDGDVFTEFGVLGLVTVDGAGSVFSTPGGDSRVIYYRFNDLQGQIANFNNPTGTDATIDNFIADPDFFGQLTYDLVFTPGVGTIELLYGVDLFSAPLGTIATFELTAGQGTGPQLLAGAGGNSPFSFNINMLSVMDDFWTFNGTKAEDLLADGLAITGFADVNARVTSIVPDADNNQFIIGIENSGTMRHNVVPEPSTILLLGAGLVGLGLLGRRKMMNK